MIEEKSLRKEKILIVEDEATTRVLLAAELGKAGYQVLQAEDGVAGFQIAKAMKPDLIISDILMPQMDGNELMKKLRESEIGKNIYFIVLSSRTQMKDYFEMMKADAFISKPFNAADLLAKVDRVLDRSRKEKRAEAEQTALAKRKKVLILDNEKSEYEKYKKILMDNKYEVNVAKSLDECLETAITFKPNLVALRFLIDRINGDKMIKTLKEISSIRNVPYVVYSRKIRGWEEKKVLDAGGTSFVGEVTDEKLLEAINEAVEKF
jgi:DNA-binding response OmpR family regulator